MKQKSKINKQLFSDKIQGMKRKLVWKAGEGGKAKKNNLKEVEIKNEDKEKETTKVIEEERK